MPVVKVHYAVGVTADDLDAIIGALREAVPIAVDCAEERFDGALRPGDLNLITIPGLTTHGELSVVVEVQTRDLPSRAIDHDRRAAVIRNVIERVYGGTVGVWLVLLAAGWSQTGDE